MAALEGSNNGRSGSGSPGRARVEPPPPISNWTIAGAALLVAAVTGVLWWYLVGIAREPVPPPAPGTASAPSASVQIDAIRTALTAAAGTGGAMALLLAFRRQRHTEQSTQINYQTARDDYEQREAAARDVAEDARQRRVTELYTAASEQLGSAKAPVRLAGLYALERLAQSNPSQRQTIVNVWCAYLRMPYPPVPETNDGDGEQAGPQAANQAREEGEVRLTAQRLLATHLRPGGSPDQPLDTYWSEVKVVGPYGAPLPRPDDKPDQPLGTYWREVVEVDLTGARLHRLDLTGCRLPPATRFDGASFTGDATRFDGASFTGSAAFAGAKFTGNVVFARARFAGEAWFGRASFTRGAIFWGASFAADAVFDEATFTGIVVFFGASFTGDARFNGAKARNDNHAWPRGWNLTEEADEAGYHRLVQVPESDDR